MNGATLVLSFMSAARPTAATVPATCIVDSSHASMSPPRLSIAPAHVERSSGRGREKSSDCRNSTSFAPMLFR
jgi:hypothetical protein